jgi:hypothetical protein
MIRTGFCTCDKVSFGGHRNPNALEQRVLGTRETRMAFGLVRIQRSQLMENLQHLRNLHKCGASDARCRNYKVRNQVREGARRKSRETIAR